MADPGLIQALDYILNRSDESSIEALAQAVVRRRRDFRAFNGITAPDPQRMAKEIAGQISSGVGMSVESMKNSVRDMAARIIKEHAPELSPRQADELCRAWIPETGGKEGNPAVPRDMLASMIEQFIAFSRGTMGEAVDKNLRGEMGAWPERYWKTFPAVIRALIADFLKERITVKEFNLKMGAALDL
jgi:hypothetical protein